MANTKIRKRKNVENETLCSKIRGSLHDHTVEMRFLTLLMTMEEENISENRTSKVLSVAKNGDMEGMY
jgi:hypothetical protein